LATRESQAQRRDDCVLVSSLDGQGVDELLEKIEQRPPYKRTVHYIMVDAADGKGMAWQHQRGEGLARKAYADGRTKLSVRFDADTAGQAQSKFGKAMKAKA
jgi:50S ribosomal subunit-associated GTPase HflX